MPSTPARRAQRGCEVSARHAPSLRADGKQRSEPLSRAHSSWCSRQPAMKSPGDSVGPASGSGADVRKQDQVLWSALLGMLCAVTAESCC